MKHCLFYALVLFLCNALFFNKLAAETEPAIYHVQQYSIEHGLRQSMVSQIITDDNQLLWLVTGDGLHCFDGKSFKAFRIQQKDRHRMSNNMMRHLLQIEPGHFVISSSSGLIHFCAYNGSMHFLKRQEGTYFLLTGVVINKEALAWSGNSGFLLAGTENSRQVIFQFKGSAAPTNFIPDKAVKTKTGTIIIQGNNGLIEFKPRAENRRALNSSSKQQSSQHTGSIRYNAVWIPVPDCKSIVIDHLNTIYVLRGQHIYRYYGNNNWQFVTHTGVKTGSTLFSDKSGNLWFTDNAQSQLYRYKNNAIQPVQLLISENKHTDTLTSSVRCVYEDANNNIWFGTDGYGLLKHDPDAVAFKKALTGFTRAITGNEQTIWAGTFNNGLWKMQPDLSKLQRILPQLFNDNSYILALHYDHRQHLWVVSRNGLHVLSTKIRSYGNTPLTAIRQVSFMLRMTLCK